MAETETCLPPLPLLSAATQPLLEAGEALVPATSRRPQLHLTAYPHQHDNPPDETPASRGHGRCWVSLSVPQMLKLAAPVNSWVSIAVEGGHTRKALVTLRECNTDDTANTDSDDQIIVDPWLHANINAHRPGRLWHPYTVRVTRTIPPQTATSMKLARVWTAEMHPKIDFSGDLRDILLADSGCLLTVGDVLAVEHHPKDFFQSNIDRPSVVALFKVVETHVSCSSRSEAVTASTVETCRITEETTVSEEGKVRGRYLVDTLPPKGFDIRHRPCVSSIELSFATMSQPDYAEYQLMRALLIFGPRSVGKVRAVREASRSFGYHVLERQCHRVAGDTVQRTVAHLTECFKQAHQRSPCVLLLRRVEDLEDPEGTSDDPRLAAAIKNLLQNKVEGVNLTGFVIVAATTRASQSEQNTDLFRSFLNSVEVPCPTGDERLAILSELLARLKNDVTCDVQAAVEMTPGFTFLGLRQLLSTALMLAKQSPTDGSICIDDATLKTALDQLQQSTSSGLAKPSIAKVKWEDVGGLATAKQEILDTIEFPLKHPELVTPELRRSGVLLYGPPGTGKTLLAKAVATECGLNFLSVKGPELINMYVGESEANVRKVFEQGRLTRPCVIFFDELDSLAPNRGRSGDSGGVMDRIVSQLLAEIDGMESGGDVFIIGATNRPDLLDPALLRPGRLDRTVYLGVASSKDEQRLIFRALTSKFTLEDDFDEDAILNELPLSLTGSDLYAICSEAYLTAVRATIAELRNGSSNAADKKTVTLTTDIFLKAVAGASPSLKPEDHARYEALRQQFSQ